MPMSTWLQALFAAIDSKSTTQFAEFLAPECRFRFGNMPAVVGALEVAEFVEQFFNSIAGLSHVIDEFWQVEDGLVCHGRVTYTRHDQTTLTVPFCNVFKLDAHKVQDYLIFADTSALYAAG